MKSLLSRITTFSVISIMVIIAGVVICFLSYEGGMYWEFVFIWSLLGIFVGLVVLLIDSLLFKKYGQRNTNIIECIGLAVLAVLTILFNILQILLFTFNLKFNL